SMRISIWPAVRARTASARRASRLRATRALSAGTSSHGRDEAGDEPFEPRSRSIPARHEDLAAVLVDRIEQSSRHELRLGDDAVEQSRRAATLREAGCLDQTGE